MLPVTSTPGTKIHVQFNRVHRTVISKSNQPFRINVNPKHSSIPQKNPKLVVTLFRNDTSSCYKCLSKVIENIEKADKRVFIFIQLDKPIYKPGDKINFRVLVVDRDMKPYKIDKKIDVKILDPLNHLIKEYNEPSVPNIGVFIEKFSLGENTPLGNWKIEVSVDKITKTKSFPVRKYTLPPFDAFISTKFSSLRIQMPEVQIFFHAKYSFGDFVRGNAVLTIRCLSENRVALVETFTNKTRITSFKHNLSQFVSNIKTENIKFEAEIEFIEPESGISAKKITKFNIFNGPRIKLKVDHPNEFVPGIPFKVKVVVKDWKDELIQNSVDKVSINYDITFSGEHCASFGYDANIINGIATFIRVFQNESETFNFKVEYLFATYRQNIKKCSFAIDRQSLLVDHEPKK